MDDMRASTGSSTLIPFSDVTRQVAELRPVIDQALDRVLRSGEFERGEVLSGFEEEYARFCGVRYGVGVGSGYASLFIALKACDIGAGDEVISVANTDMATISAISHTGARPVFVDIDPHSFNMDPNQVEAAISPRTKAILPVHLYGLPADMDPILEIARHHGLVVIEDAALAAGAKYRGRPTGSLGDVGCFSFAPPKIIGALGDGGIIVTDDPRIADLARLWGSYGEQRFYEEIGPVRLRKPQEHAVQGYHSHLDPVQAAVLHEKMRYIGEWIARRQTIARMYDAGFVDLDVVIQRVPEGFVHVYRNYVLRVRDRDRVRRMLAARHIETAVLYAPALHLQPACRHLGYGPGSLPETEAMAAEILALPMFPELTDDEAARVIEAMRCALSPPAG